MSRRISDAEFTAVWQQLKSPAAVARKFGLNVRSVYERRNSLADKGILLPTESLDGQKAKFSQDTAAKMHFERRRTVDVKNGHIIIFSDPHFYPDHNTVALEALLTLIDTFKPKAVLCGGDALDGTQISRHDPTRGWHEPATLEEQLDCLTTQMTTIKKRAKGAVTMMTLGNHDARLSRYLAVSSPHVKNLPFTSLEDYIPSWPLSWTILINGNTILRHRSMAGMLHMQAQKAGCHYIHGHLHKLNVHALPQYKGFVYSVDCGSFADPTSDAFDYAEDCPPHVQGFAVLTYKDGELLWPELCYLQEGKAYFRGKVV